MLQHVGGGQKTSLSVLAFYLLRDRVSLVYHNLYHNLMPAGPQASREFPVSASRGSGGTGNSVTAARFSVWVLSMIRLAMVRSSCLPGGHFTR